MDRLKHKISSELDIHFMKSELDQFLVPYNLTENCRIKLNTVLSELAYNQLKYAKKGSIEISFFKDAARKGIKIKATDKGPGIQNLDLALQDNYSTSGTLGLGLPGVKRLVDEFEIKSVVNQGTTLEAIVWIQE
jgi:serine/threonine-protein kinase RsbT